jgi:ParB-like chromosome segregation protein Spo0J
MSERRSVHDVDEIVWVPIEDLRANPWNPNAMDPEMFAKAVESIHRFGFIDPVTGRDFVGDGYVEIIDGEHRWKAAREHSGQCVRGKDGEYVKHVPMGSVPVVLLEGIDDGTAQQLTIVLNETRGTYDPKKMGELLTKLIAVEPLPALTSVLPFSKERIEELAELPKVDWDSVPERPKARAGRDEKWVERVYRLPAEAAQQLDDAIRAARDEPGAPDWRALQTIAEHFLGA